MPRVITPQRLLDTKEVAAYLNVSTMTVRRYVAAGRLEHIKIGGPHTPRLRFTKGQVANFIRRMKGKTAAEVRTKKTKTP